MMNWLKNIIVDSRHEKFARSLYIRLNYAPSGKPDQETLTIMRRCLSSNSNCVDIGAHRGSILAEMIKLAPHGTHYAFEPVPQHSSYLMRAFPEALVYQMALSNLKGRAKFTHDLQHPTRSSFYRDQQDDRLEHETIQVDTDLLDNMIPSSIKITLMKIDVEGAEYQVLLGGLKTIRANKPFIIFEHTSVSETIYNASSTQLYDLLINECQMRISLLSDWIKKRSPLNRQDFCDIVRNNASCYFVSHSENKNIESIK